MARKRHYLSHEERLKIVFMAEQGHSHRFIAAKMGVNRKTVGSVVVKKAETGSVADKQCSGTSRKTSVRQDRQLARTSMSNRC